MARWLLGTNAMFAIYRIVVFALITFAATFVCAGQRGKLSRDVIDGARRVGLGAVSQSCALTRDVASQLISADAKAKGDSSPVTVADFGAQALIAEQLRRAYPQIPLLAEESSAMLRADANLLAKVVHFVRRQDPSMDANAVLAAIDRGGSSSGQHKTYFVLDPIDGTKGYLRKQQYAIGLGLVHRGRVVMGVLGLPNMPGRASVRGSTLIRGAGGAGAKARLGKILSATRGRGTIEHDVTGRVVGHVRVSAERRGRHAKLVERVEASEKQQLQFAALAGALGTREQPLRMDSMAKYGAVATGEVDAYVRLSRPGAEKQWDHVAGTIVLQEAGGRVTDLNGKRLRFGRGRKFVGNHGIIATNGKLHRRLLRAVRRGHLGK